jgi:acyl transferase domain-containing protein
MKTTKNSPVDIAVVGASALFPGSIGAQSFWRNILEGRDFMSDVPADNWLIDDFFDSDPSKTGKIYARRGAFLPKVDFDPIAHGIPPNQLASTDTVQLLSLIVAQKVLDDAASVQFGKVSKQDISVILGIASATELVGQMAARIQRPHWIKALRDMGMPESQVQEACARIENTYPEWNESTFPGLLGNVVAGRIANRLDLGGANCVVDAACASSLGAVAMAAQELQLGHSDLVITGGADCLNDIFMYMCFSKTPALSPTGDCRPFADAADGTMLGEGIGMVALRRLADAERDGDRIYAVLRGIGSSSDGRAKSIYAPRAEGQERAIRRAYDRAGYGPETVGLLEAHGTATKAGDLAEFGGLQRAFAEVEGREAIALGSVKSQIGHTKAAAGAASLFKVVMALHHKVLPPTIKIDKPNRKMDIQNTPFYLNTETRPWIQAPGVPRRASVSSFGFGGSNFHLTLEEYAGEGNRALRTSSLTTHLLLLAADGAEALLTAAKDLGAALTSRPLDVVARETQLAFPATARRRLAVIAGDAEGAIADLAKAVQQIGQDAEKPFSLAHRMHYQVGAERPKIAFLFPGQGSQYPNMGRALAVEFDAARKVWDEAAVLKLDPDHALQQVVFPVPVFDDAARAVQTDRLTRTDWAQPALGAASLAVMALLDQVGVTPDAVAGHSYGEVVALHAAGVIESAIDMLAISRRRGELMRAAGSTPGAMMAVGVSAADAAALLKAHAPDVSIANVNSPKQVVVAGARPDIEAFHAVLKQTGVACSILPVATAFHTAMVAGSAKPFAEFLAGKSMSAPRIPVYGNSRAEPYADDPKAARAALAGQLAQPVLFADMIERMYADGCRLFVEVGPGSVLTGMVGDCLAGRPHVAVATDHRKQDGRAALFNALAVMSVSGVIVDYAALWAPFAPIELQKPEKLSAASVKLGGANYGKPYPAGGGVKAPAPNPERPVPAARSAPAALAAPAPKSEPVMALAPQLAQAQAPAPAPVSAMGDEGWAAFQAMQQNMLEAQKTFTEAMASSHQAFLRASETSMLQLGGARALPASPTTTATAPAPIVVAPAPVPAVVPPPAHIEPKVVALPTPRPVTPAPVRSSPPARDAEALLLAVVAEKTGYPVEMLTLDMELEAGLGIDSIKRVQILSALQEKLPELAAVDANALAALNTLGEIVAFARATAPVVSDPSVLAAAVSPTAPVQDVTRLLLEVVADKTGYPVEMLTLDMELEAGLGIDSIKRVQILSALQEKLPELAAVDANALAALNTLGEIVAFAGAGAAAPMAAAPLASPVASAAPAPDVTRMLLDVVAEKTGYPVEMLSLDMELEAGLGIDSIKRVQILSALQEKLPELAAVDANALAALNTLGEIVAFAGAGAMAPQPAPAHAVTAPVALVTPPLDATRLLLEVVADKTGYPVEMLSLDMELEAGLGIDSIKRVQILSALQEKLPELAAVDSNALAALNTLGEIVAFAQGGQAEPSAAAPEEPAVGNSALAMQRLAVEIVESTACGLVTPGLLGNDRVWLAGGPPDLAAALAAALARAGVAAEAVAEAPTDARAVIVLSGLTPSADAAAHAALNEVAFRQLQACAATMAERGRMLVTVQSTGGDFGLSGAGIAAWSAGIAAAAKTAALEWPHVSLRAIDIAPASPEVMAERLVVELLVGGSQLEVGLAADGRRLSPKAAPQPSLRPVPAPFPTDGVLLVSGGARGVTPVCLRALLTRQPVKVAILGRTVLQPEPEGLAGFAADADLKRARMRQAAAEGRKLTPQQLGAEVRAILAMREIKANIDALAATGAEVRYFPVDVADAAAVGAVVADIRSSFGPLRGLVHAAGVLADKEIRHKTLDQFRSVMTTKADGLRNLLAATADDALTHIVCFSSVAAWRGNIGQVDYAMANEVLNRVCRAEQMRRPDGLVKAIGWGPWAGGMVDAGLEAHFAAMGVGLIPLDDGARFFADAFQGLDGDAPEVLYGGGLASFGGHAPEPEDGHVFEARFHQHTHPWIASHVVRGKPVVPLTAAHDLALQAVRQWLPHAAVQSSAAIQVDQGMVLDGYSTGGDVFRIECKRTDVREQVAVRILYPDGALAYRLVLRLAPQAVEPSGEPLALPAWPAGKAVYDGRLFHGEALRVIERIEGFSDAGATAVLRSPGPAPIGAAAPVDILDGGLQLAVLWAHEHLGQESLPTGIDALRLLRPWPWGEAIRCEAVLRPGGAKLMTEWTMRFTDRTGALLAVIEGLKMHVLPARDGVPASSLNVGVA